jgi:SagB-type dehydrogenase family enzyme
MENGKLYLTNKNIKHMKKLALLILLAISVNLSAQDIALPKPVTTGGRPLMEALNARRTERVFADKDFSNAQLSNLLWAANGINRPESEKRTAPTASNNQEIDIYVFLKTGVYLYDAKSNKLLLKTKGDHRKEVSTQPFVETAPVVLVFTADFDKMKRYPEEGRVYYSAVDAGYVSQNVYLYAASEGLSTVVLGMIKKDELAKLLNLKNGKVLLGQPIGFPGK